MLSDEKLLANEAEEESKKDGSKEKSKGIINDLNKENYL